MAIIRGKYESKRDLFGTSWQELDQAMRGWGAQETCRICRGSIHIKMTKELTKWVFRRREDHAGCACSYRKRSVFIQAVKYRAIPRPMLVVDNGMHTGGF